MHIYVTILNELFFTINIQLHYLKEKMWQDKASLATTPISATLQVPFPCLSVCLSPSLSLSPTLSLQVSLSLSRSHLSRLPQSAAAPMAIADLAIPSFHSC